MVASTLGGRCPQVFIGSVPSGPSKHPYLRVSERRERDHKYRILRSCARLLGPLGTPQPVKGCPRDPCRDNARWFLPDGPDTTLLLWEAFIEQCPEMDLVADALDQLAGFHHRQAAACQAEAAALRKRIGEASRQPPPGSSEHSGNSPGGYHD